MAKQESYGVAVCKCERCGHVWMAREGLPKRCAGAKCKSPYWDVAREEKGPRLGISVDTVEESGRIPIAGVRMKFRSEGMSTLAATRMGIEHHPQCKCGICVAADPKKQPEAAAKKKWVKGAK